ncbi:unnamed protein product [Effrenium voratum]|nr:unnamed protein product [Effrenium voratum]
MGRAAVRAGLTLGCLLVGLAPSWVSQVPRRAGVPAVAEVESLLPELLELGAAGGAGLEERLEEVFSEVSPDDLSTLRLKVSDPEDPDHQAAQRVGDAIQGAMSRRLSDAKNVLEDLITNSDGDVNIRIRKTIKSLESPLPVLMVLQLNIAEAQQKGDGERVQVLMHISTVMQEELEKKASRVRAMLNKLLRIEDENIRNNILRDQLTPVEVAGAPMGGGAPLMAAMVPWERLAPAIAILVEEVDRQMVAVLGPDDDARYETMERIREVAKQARLIIGEVYGQGVMDTFSADLTTPAFHTLMSYKASRPKPEKEGAESGAGVEGAEGAEEAAAEDSAAAEE